jgi:hypothetical protein
MDKTHLSFNLLEIGHAIGVRIHIVQLLRARLGCCLSGGHKVRKRLLFLVHCCRRGWRSTEARAVAELKQTLGTTRATVFGAERIAEKCACSVVDLLSVVRSASERCIYTATFERLHNIQALASHLKA